MSFCHDDSLKPFTGVQGFRMNGHIGVILWKQFEIFLLLADLVALLYIFHSDTLVVSLRGIREVVSIIINRSFKQDTENASHTNLMALAVLIVTRTEYFGSWAVQEFRASDNFGFI